MKINLLLGSFDSHPAPWHQHRIVSDSPRGTLRDQGIPIARPHPDKTQTTFGPKRLGELCGFCHSQPLDVGCVRSCDRQPFDKGCGVRGGVGIFALGRRTLTSSKRSAGVITETGQVPKPVSLPSPAGENPVSRRDIAVETLTMFLKSDSDRVDKTAIGISSSRPSGKALRHRSVVPHWTTGRRGHIQRSANSTSSIDCRCGER